MKKILEIFALTFLFANSAFAETKEKKRAKYVLLNMHQDYIACYSFYIIGSKYIKKTNGQTSIIEGMEKSADNSLRLAYETGEMMGMTIDEMSIKVKSEMKNQVDLVGNNFENAEKLLGKYAKTCKSLIENKKKRISVWEKKATNKFK